MGRYTFTTADLARIRPLLTAPIVRRLVEATIPVKRFAAPNRHVERLPLAVAIKRRDNPDGVDLGDILTAVRSVHPAARGVAVRDGILTVISDRAPAPAERRKLGALLSNRDKLSRLRQQPERFAAADLARVLRDDTTDDQEWLRAFRRYATEHLIPRDGEPAPGGAQPAPGSAGPAPGSAGPAPGGAGPAPGEGGPALRGGGPQ